MRSRILAAWCGCAALALASGQHRLLYRAAAAVDAPELAVAAVAGATGLAWYEVAYAVGWGLKSAAVFVLVPHVGVAAGLAAAAGLLAGPRWLVRAAAVQVACALGAGGLALALVVGRGLRGYPDPWRLAALASFVAVQGAWALHLLREERRRRASARPAGAPLAGRVRNVGS
jgi:hypothetical protein